MSGMGNMISDNNAKNEKLYLEIDDKVRVGEMFSYTNNKI